MVLRPTKACTMLVRQLLKPLNTELNPPGAFWIFECQQGNPSHSQESGLWSGLACYTPHQECPCHLGASWRLPSSSSPLRQSVPKGCPFWGFLLLEPRSRDSVIQESPGLPLRVGNAWWPRRQKVTLETPLSSGQKCSVLPSAGYLRPAPTGPCLHPSA